MMGRTVAHYQILEKLGEGGMGVVYKARDTHLDRFVAMKVLPPEKVADPGRKARFVQEAKAASALNHPNIIVVHDISSDAGVDFIAMEYVSGKTLDQIIPRKGMRLGEALKVAVQVADALARAHSAGIVHRDLKPANVMVDEHGLVKVLDFGLAKLTEVAPLDDGASTRTQRPQTEEGQIVGTVAYMSPEQAQALPVDARSDVFSFGSLLYEMVTGRRAFQENTKFSTLAAIIKQEPAPVAAETPHDLEKIITRCLRKDPDRRFQHMEDLKVALEELKEEPGSGTLAAAAPAAKRRSWGWLVAGVLAVALAAVSAVYLWRHIPHRPAQGPEQVDRSAAAEPAIAVLPFANLSADKENEYFSDGLAEEVINALTALPGLRVVARTSAFAFRGREQDIREIGARLHVGYVLEGSVRRAGNRIRVTAQLISVADGYHLFSERYDREMTDVFAIQDAICRAIVDRLKMRLAQDRPLVRRQTENVKAYQLYLNGVYQMNRFTPDALAKAREYFERATAEDPGYPLAYIGLGAYFVHSAHFGFQRPREALARAREMALKALEIDDGLALGHALLGTIRGMDYDWPGAEQEFRRALELDRQTIEIWPGYDYYWLVSMRRLDEAVAASRRALEQDPLSPFARWRLAYRHYLRREFDLAIRYCRNALELDPNYLAANDFLGLALLQQGKPDEAIQAHEKSVAFARRAPFTLGTLGFAYGMAGQAGQARRLLAELEGLAPRVYVPPSSFGRIYLGLGEIERAFDWIEKAVDEREGIVVHVHLDPMFDRLRSHPRYSALLRRMNLQP
jgi:TolB-like protein/Tfp pilus assembly protein PilF/predicted Ser/Thr protein kinase